MATYGSAVLVESSVDEIIAKATMDLGLSPLPAILPEQGEDDAVELQVEFGRPVEDVGADHSGVDGEGSNPVRRPLLGQRLGEHDVGQLGVSIGLELRSFIKVSNQNMSETRKPKFSLLSSNLDAHCLFSDSFHLS